MVGGTGMVGRDESKRLLFVRICNLVRGVSQLLSYVWGDFVTIVGGGPAGTRALSERGFSQLESGQGKNVHNYMKIKIIIHAAP